MLRLFDAIVEERPAALTHPGAVALPVLLNYGGNVSPEIVGLERFEQYYVPHYQSFCEIMHAGGKTVACISTPIPR